jgi:2-methylisocitrate lyase-like PEP mutase family enzyme
MAIGDGLGEKAEALRALHREGDPVVLVNAWDAVSARLVERAGFPAVATTSAGIAFSEGYPDGERIPPARMLERVARICAAVRVPVTADMEAGYGDSPDALARTVTGMLEAGAVGLNLEDFGDAGLASVESQVAKIEAVRSAAARAGVPVVLNARTDVFLAKVGPESGRLEEAVRRGLAYRSAGADCVFVPGVTDGATIGALVRRLGCPVNVLAKAEAPAIAELAKLGVARVSLGSGPMRAAMTVVSRLAEEVRTRGTYTDLEGILTHASFDELMR